MNNEIKNYILKYLEKKQPLPNQACIENYNYMESGHIDSMGLMKFVVEIEETFNIEITPVDMVSDKFKTIAGLVKLIENKIIT